MQNGLCNALISLEAASYLPDALFAWYKQHAICKKCSFIV